MQIERNLYKPLRSFVERIIEETDELSSKDVFVDKDKKQKKQSDSNSNLTQEKEENSDTVTNTEMPTIGTTLAKRLDIIA